jgi:hypothetical protein
VDDRIKKITKRVKRLFKKEAPKKPRPTGASEVICPEQVIPQHGKRAPKPTSKFSHSAVMRLENLTICVLANGTTHVKFEIPDLTKVAVRDPVTRRLSRRELRDGMRKTTGFYDKKGNLHEESGTDW